MIRDNGRLDYSAGGCVELREMGDFPGVVVGAGERKERKGVLKNFSEGGNY